MNTKEIIKKKLAELEKRGVENTAMMEAFKEAIKEGKAK